jgi:hypothetical protein
MFGTWNHVVSQRDQALCHRASHVDRAMTAAEDDLLLSAGELIVAPSAPTGASWAIRGEIVELSRRPNALATSFDA